MATYAYEGNSPVFLRLSEPREPEPLPADDGEPMGARLWREYMAIEDSDGRDDWYAALAPGERLALIEQRALLHRREGRER